MRETLVLWALLRRRTEGSGAGGSGDRRRLTEVLAVVAFATTTAVLLVVVGGFGAFWARAGGAAGIDEGMSAGGDGSFAAQYPILAGIAALLILVPLGTLGAAAARLAAARRDARLAALRLCGATRSQVAGLTLLDAAAQAVVGAAIGVVGYAALVPLVARVRFQERTFAWSELWVGLPALLAAVAAVVAIAVLSALVSLRRVAITPLGVADRVTPPGMRAVRLLSTVVAVLGLVVVSRVSFGSLGVAIALTTGFLVLSFLTMNLVGPFAVWLLGHATAYAARSVPTLLAGRRLVDAPRSAWRSVGGVGLATFTAGLTSILSIFDPADGSSAAEVAFIVDLRTGGFLTLAIAGVLAAVSTGVMQAGRVIEQQAEYRALALAGTEDRTLDAARLRETLIPLVACVGVASVTVLMVMIPLAGLGNATDPGVVVQYLACVLAASALVFAGAAASRGVARAVGRPA